MRLPGFGSGRSRDAESAKRGRAIRIFGYAQKKITEEKPGTEETEGTQTTTDDGQKVITAAPKETEAESVAYVVAGLLGVDTSRYIAGWSHGDAETIKNTAARVLHAAHALAEAITDTTEKTAPA